MNSVINTVRCSVIFTAAASLVMLARVSQADEVEFQRVWQQIRNAETTAEDRAAEPYIYWDEIAFECSNRFYGFDGVKVKSFRDLVKVKRFNDPKQRRQFLKYYVDQFGRHGSQADMRWLLVDVRLTLPKNEPIPPYSLFTFFPADVGSDFSEFVVRRCLADKKFLHRYYVAVLSTGIFLRHPVRKDGADLPYGSLTSGDFFAALKHTARGLEKGDKRAHWGFARRFVLLAHATGRDDLLADVDPDDLHKRFPEFHEWVIENVRFLRPRPKNFSWRLDQAAKNDKAAISTKELPLAPMAFPASPFPDWPPDLPPPPISLYRRI